MSKFAPPPRPHANLNRALSTGNKLDLIQHLQGAHHDVNAEEFLWAISALLGIPQHQAHGDREAAEFQSMQEQRVEGLRRLAKVL